jgi:SMI1 / KNR4 family (SUKH-1)
VSQRNEAPRRNPGFVPRSAQAIRWIGHPTGLEAVAKWRSLDPKSWCRGWKLGSGGGCPSRIANASFGKNGGEVWAARQNWTLYPVWDPTNRKTMGRTANHIVRENQALRNDWADVLPDGFLAIADNGGGDLLVISPGEDDVQFWDHETRELSPVNVKWVDQ